MMELSETQGLCTSLVAAFLLGCGATATPAAQAPSSPPSAMLPDRVSARSLSLYVNPSANANVNAFRAMIMEHLVKLGYTVTDAAESADVTIDMAFAVSANKPVFLPLQQNLWASQSGSGSSPSAWYRAISACS